MYRGLVETAKLCEIKFMEYKQESGFIEPFDIGDGSLNKVSAGYAFALGAEWQLFRQRLDSGKKFTTFCMPENTARFVWNNATKGLWKTGPMRRSAGRRFLSVTSSCSRPRQRPFFAPGLPVEFSSSLQKINRCNRRKSGDHARACRNRWGRLVAIFLLPFCCGAALGFVQSACARAEVRTRRKIRCSLARRAGW